MRYNYRGSPRFCLNTHYYDRGWDDKPSRWCVKRFGEFHNSHSKILYIIMYSNCLAYKTKLSCKVRAVCVTAANCNIHFKCSTRNNIIKYYSKFIIGKLYCIRKTAKVASTQSEIDNFQDRRRASGLRINGYYLFLTLSLRAR